MDASILVVRWTKDGTPAMLAAMLWVTSSPQRGESSSMEIVTGILPGICIVVVAIWSVLLEKGFVVCFGISIMVL